MMAGQERSAGDAIPPRLDSTDTHGIDLFRGSLARAGYRFAHIQEVLHAEGESVVPSAGQAAVLMRLLPPDAALTTLLALYLFRIPVGRAAAERAIAPLTVERAVTLGVLGVDGHRAEGTIRILPYRDWIFACDRESEGAPALQADHVMGVTGSSVLLANLVPRGRVRDALDVGSGQGLQTVTLAAHADHVVATDISPRAVDFTAFNARLNGALNVTARLGSLFAPVAGEQFDLIVSNPPFVISPESQLTYRDSGCRGDEISREVVRGGFSHLRDGGTAVTLVSWIASLDAPWSTTPRSWTADLEGDAWLLHCATDTALAHAASWLQPLQSLDPAAYRTRLDEWTRYYEQLGVEAIGYGATILRRREGKPHWVRADDLGMGHPADAGDQLAALARAQDLLASLPGPRALLDAVLAIEPRHRLDQVLRASGGAYGVDEAMLRVEAPISFRMPVNGFVAQLFAALDGRRTVRQAAEVAAGAFPPEDTRSEGVERAVLDAARRFIDLGLANLIRL